MSERTDSWAKGGMRLSEAIRIGAMMHEQVHGIGVYREVDGSIAGTCALGAAALASGYKAECQAFAEQFRLTDRVWHPIKMFPMPLGSIITDLNDTHKWTRNAIADWVEQEENKEIARYEQAVREEHEWQSKRENSIANRSNSGSIVSE